MRRSFGSYKAQRLKQHKRSLFGCSVFHFSILFPKREPWRRNALNLRTAVFAPIWTYGLELCGCTSKSNIAIIQRFQSKLLTVIVNAPRYITNAMIHSDLGIPTVQDVIHGRSNKHRAKLQSHPNPLLQSLSKDNIPRRLKRRWPTDL
jgi:hypothetical protein